MQRNRNDEHRSLLPAMGNRDRIGQPPAERFRKGTHAFKLVQMDELAKCAAIGREGVGTGERRVCLAARCTAQCFRLHEPCGTLRFHADGVSAAPAYRVSRRLQAAKTRVTHRPRSSPQQRQGAGAACLGCEQGGNSTQQS